MCMRIKKRSALILMLSMLLCLLSACSAKGASGADQSIENLAGKKIGVVAGSVLDEAARNAIADVQVEYYSSSPELAAALEKGEIDGYVEDEPVMRVLTAENPNQHALATLEKDQYGFIFPKSEAGAALRDRFNGFLGKLNSSGELQKIDSLWFGNDESAKLVDLESLTAENGTLTYAAASGMAPFTYLKDEKPVGYDIDIAARFCREFGYGLEVTVMDFADMLESVASGRSSFGSGSISITEERKARLFFSEPEYIGGMVLVVRDGAAAAEIGSSEEMGINSLEDLAGKKIGILTDTIFGEIAKEYIRDPKLSNIKTLAEMAEALEKGKLDAYLADEPMMRIMLRDYPRQRVLSTLEADQYAFVFPKNDKGAALREQLNAYLAKIKEDGTLSEIDDIWFGNYEAQKVVDLDSLTGENGTLKLVTEAAYAPFNYRKDGEIVGFEIDIAARFCKEYGYKLEVTAADFDDLLDSVIAGESDFAASCISVTEERKESMYFSEPEYEGGIVVVVNSSAGTEERESNFFREKFRAIFGGK